MALETWLAFCATETVLCLIPGPAVLFVVSIALLLGGFRPTTAASPYVVRRAFLRGVLVQGANPKALVFFMALLPQFIESSARVTYQVVLVGLTSVVIEFFMLMIYVALGVRARAVAGSQLDGLLQRIGGGFLVAAGARLAVVRSH
jgi:threonine/homoserine/homoserine lactone efflux protein